MSGEPNRGAGRRFYWLYAALAIGVGAWWLSQAGGSDEELIERQLHRVAELVAKSSEEKALESADRARRLGEMFDREMLIELLPLGVEIGSAAELVRPFVGLRRQTETLSVSFDTEELTVAREFPTATWVGRVTVVGRGGDQSGRESFRLHIEWKKVRGDWLIETLRVTERLEGNGLGF